MYAYQFLYYKIDVIVKLDNIGKTISSHLFFATCLYTSIVDVQWRYCLLNDRINVFWDKDSQEQGIK